MNIPFTKMHGLGNDFVVLDGVRNAIHLTPQCIVKMADRHRGIGFDQLLLIEPSVQSTADFVYRIFNADGTEASQCGNGARCVGRFLFDSHLVPPGATRILLATEQRIIEVHPSQDNQITVNMGVPLLEPVEIPFQAQGRRVGYAIDVDGQTVEVDVVNMGNPHAVLLIDDVATAPVPLLGPKLRHHIRFPKGANVGFMQCVSQNKIRLRVYERGVGETQACGSGACAAVVVGCLRGLLGTQVEVQLTGGTLNISWLGENHPVWMTGPAESVFTGEFLSS
jgi:diaminopimelate epimerase